MTWRAEAPSAEEALLSDKTLLEKPGPCDGPAVRRAGRRLLGNNQLRLVNAQGLARYLDAVFEEDGTAELNTSELLMLCTEAKGRFSYGRMDSRLLCLMGRALTFRKRYGEAFPIFDAVRERELAPPDHFRLYAPFFGKCCLEKGEEERAFHIWTGPTEDVTRPLDQVVWRGFGPDLRRICDVEDQAWQVIQELYRAEDFLAGEIPASLYYSRYYSNWKSMTGERFDFLWRRDPETDRWKKRPHRATLADRFRELGRRMEC